MVLVQYTCTCSNIYSLYCLLHLKYVKSLEGVVESGILEEPLLSDVKTMIALSYEKGDVYDSTKAIIWNKYCLGVYSNPSSFTFSLIILNEYGSNFLYNIPNIYTNAVEVTPSVPNNINVTSINNNQNISYIYLITRSNILTLSI